MKTLLMLLMFVFFGFGSCDNRQWKMSISSPQNGATVSTASIDMKGTLYLSSSLTEDNNILKSLTKEQRTELEKKVPPLSGNIYCNSKKATIDRTNRTWLLNGLPLSLGANRIFCYYQDSQGHTSQQTITVIYKAQSNTPPTANFNCQSNEPLKLNCDGSLSSDSNGSIVEYIFLSEGIEYKQSSPLINLSYSTAGNKTVELIVKDNNGALSSKVSKSFTVNNLPSTTQPIGSNGGSLSLVNYASVVIPPNTLPDNTSVSLIITNDPVTQLLTQETNILYGMTNVSSYEIRIRIPSTTPTNDLNLQLKVPQNVLDSIDSNHVPLAYAQIDESNADEKLDLFRPIISTFDEQNSTLTLALNKNTFSDNRSNGTFEAVIIISTAEVASNKNTPQVPYYQGCWGSLAVPVASPWKISSYFGPRTPTGNASANHQGLDFPVPNGTPIKATFTGVVERVNSSGFIPDGCNLLPPAPGRVCNVSSLGKHVIIKDTKTLQKVLYAHLSNVNVAVDQDVTRSTTIIGQSGNTGLPGTTFHLHMELISIFPGELITSRSNFDPLKCLTFACFRIKNIAGRHVEFENKCPDYYDNDDPIQPILGVGGPIRREEWYYDATPIKQEETTCSIVAPTKFFPSVGSHTATLRVTDYWGYQNEYTKSFSVSSGDKIEEYVSSRDFLETKNWFNIFTLTPNLTVTPQFGLGSLNATFDASTSVSSPGDFIHTYTWNIIRNPGSTQTTSTIEWCTPQYKISFGPGTYSISATLENSIGDRETSSSKNVVVLDNSGD